MKIAILGDIHGNIEALKAAYAKAVSKGVDKIYHLGDLGGYAPFVNGVVDFLIEHAIEGVQGNYDETVANDRKQPYRKDLDGKVFINAGSVGKPKDGDARTCVALVEITGGDVKTDFVMISYDIEKTAVAIIESGLPPYFAEKLREGR